MLLVTVPLGALLGLGIVRLRSFWFAFWCSVPLVLAPLCISVTPGWLPLMALVLGWCVLGLTSLVRRQDPHGAALLNLVALPAGALLLSALTLAMPQESYQRPAWADDALEHITSQVVKYSGIWLDGTGPFGGGGGGRLAASDGSVSLNSGPLRFSGRTVLEVDTELEGRIYLRGFSGALYDGERWLPLPDDIYSSLELDSGSTTTEDGDIILNISIDSIDRYPGLVHLPYLIKLRGCQPLNFPRPGRPLVRGGRGLRGGDGAQRGGRPRLCVCTLPASHPAGRAVRGGVRLRLPPGPGGGHLDAHPLRPARRRPGPGSGRPHRRRRRGGGGLPGVCPYLLHDAAE